jgi:hypothetical protein
LTNGTGLFPASELALTNGAFMAGGTGFPAARSTEDTDMQPDLKVDAVPNPGSAEAVERGCQCPILDNAHGKGYMGGVRDKKTGEIMFVVSGACEFHRDWEPCHD